MDNDELARKITLKMAKVFEKVARAQDVRVDDLWNIVKTSPNDNGTFSILSSVIVKAESQENVSSDDLFLAMENDLTTTAVMFKLNEYFKTSEHQLAMGVMSVEEKSLWMGNIRAECLERAKESMRLLDKFIAENPGVI